MKTMIWISAIFLLICFTSGCDSDSDFFQAPDNTVIKPAIDLGAELNDYLWDVDFGRAAYSKEEEGYNQMLRDTLLQSSYCDQIYETLQTFSLITISDNIYTERSKKSTITVSDNTFTLATQYNGYLDNPALYEKLNAVLVFNNTLNTWILKIYRGTDQETLWMIQEGAYVGNIWYVIIQLDDAGTTYRANFMVTGSDTPANVLLSISGQETTDPLAEGALYTGGITTGNDDWSEFQSFELTPDYSFTQGL